MGNRIKGIIVGDARNRIICDDELTSVQMGNLEAELDL